jgi:ribosome biogenesis GTPase
MRGIVIRTTGSSFIVKSDEGKIVDCKIKGNFRIKGIRSTNPVAVGDYVHFSLDDDGGALIYDIEERKNYLIRRSSNLSKQTQILAANLDLLALVLTVNYPETSTVFIDRFLATAEAYQVPACLIINKTDLYDKEELEYSESLKYLYELIGYPVFFISVLKKEGLTDLIQFLTNKTTLISGNSGVGKSSFINLLIPHSNLKTGEISSFHNKGMHTTTFSEMFDLPNGGSVIDTPGIKGFGTIEMDKYEVGHFFKEIFEFSKKCRFNNCTHIHEPDCAVLKAVENHYISESRYKSYLSILEDDINEKYR